MQVTRRRIGCHPVDISVIDGNLYWEIPVLAPDPDTGPGFKRRAFATFLLDLEVGVVRDVHGEVANFEPYSDTIRGWWPKQEERHYSYGALIIPGTLVHAMQSRVTRED